MLTDTTSKLLVIAYKSPPVQTPGSLRIYHLLRQLKQHFSAIYLQQSANCRFFNQDEALALPNTITTLQVPTKDIRSRAGWQATHLSSNQKEKTWFRFLAPLYHAYPFVYFTGDGGRTYIRESISAASLLIEKEGITHLFSSYRPWADHIIAYRLKKKFPHLIWIADFRDLPVDPIRKDVWWPGLQLRFEQRLMKQADIVTTVSEGLARHFRQHHKHVVVVRNGLRAAPSGFMTAPASQRFVISYTGSLYPQLQSASLLFESLRKMLDHGEINPYHLELHYAGKDATIWEQWLRQHGLGHYSVDQGMVSTMAAQNLQRNSQINLLLSWSATDYGGIMTAKLGDYLAAGRPIICLLNGPQDPELEQLVAQTGSGYVYPSTEAESTSRLHSFLLDAYRTWQFSGALPWRSNSQMLQQYTWQNQVGNLVSALNQRI